MMNRLILQTSKWQIGSYGEPAYGKTTIANWHAANQCISKGRVTAEYFIIDLKV